MKLLNIVIYSNDKLEYVEMYKLLSPYYAKFNQMVDTYFIIYDSELDANYKIVGDILKIKGVPSYVPGILLKTIDSMLYLMDHMSNYDFVIRTNISTIIDFNNLSLLLESNPNADYIGGKIKKLAFLDAPAGVVDERWFGTLFAQGTLIAMSIKFCYFLLMNRHKLHTELVDDLSIGLFIKEHSPQTTIHSINPNQYIEFESGMLEQSAIFDISSKNLPIAWRNKSPNRQDDVDNMRNIINIIRPREQS